jgi:hypothetical protein
MIFIQRVVCFLSPSLGHLWNLLGMGAFVLVFHKHILFCNAPISAWDLQNCGVEKVYQMFIVLILM